MAPKDLLAWMPDGLCVGADPDLFFPDNNTKKSTVEAKGVCFECPVLLLCREYSILHEEFGVWGGLDERERRKERRELPLSHYSDLMGEGKLLPHVAIPESDLRDLEILHSYKHEAYKRNVNALSLQEVFAGTEEIISDLEFSF